MNVEHLMTRNVVVVSPETPLKEVAAILSDRGISGLPVRDAGGSVVGVVSEADILRKEQGLPPGRSSVFDWLFGRSEEAAAKLAARTAGEAMTSPPVTIDPGRPIAEAAKLMVERTINRLPVIDGDELVGIVTRADLVRAFRRSDQEIDREIREDVLLHTLWIEPARLDLTVADGEVTLRGKLETRTEAELVAAYIRRVPGVVAVHDDLTWQVDDLERRTRSGTWEKRIV